MGARDLETVWVVTNEYRRKAGLAGLEDQLTVRASFQSALDIVRDRIRDYPCSDAQRRLWSAETDHADPDLEDQILGPYRMRAMDVEP